jgi:hypothetical protein
MREIYADVAEGSSRGPIDTLCPAGNTTPVLKDWLRGELFGVDPDSLSGGCNLIG